MADPLASPCIGVCRINVRAGLCEGCYRTGEEIAAWTQMRPDERRQLLALLPHRRGARERWR